MRTQLPLGVWDDPRAWDMLVGSLLGALVGVTLWIVAEAVHIWRTHGRQ